MTLSELLNKNAPDEFLKAIVDAMHTEYPHSHAEAYANRSEAEALDLIPHIRRANCERAFAEIARKFSDRAKGALGSNGRGNSFRFLMCGDLVFTQSYVPDGKLSPRDAVFRDCLAGHPDQLVLSAEEQAARDFLRKLRKKTYVLITHCPVSRTKPELYQISAVLVDKNCAPVDSVDLIEYLRLRVSKSIQEEIQEDRRIPKLRKDVNRKRDAGA